MTREIEAPWKPKVGDQVTFDGPSHPGQEPMTFHGKIIKVLKGTDLVHIEATGGSCYEASIETDNVRLVKVQTQSL